MAQIFRRSSNYLAKTSIVGLVLLAGGASTAFAMLWWSPYRSDVNVSVRQVVPFSHEHHVSGLGLDCRYCHTTVETSSFAGIPPTHTCMTCHSQVWTDAPMLEPVRTSYRTNTPLTWNRVHDLADFVYFDHSIHVQKGIGCATCHGRVDQMPLMRKENTLFMSWCVDCHRDPSRFIRPKEQVFDMAWAPEAPQSEIGPDLVERYEVQVDQLKDCSICHR